MKYDLNDLTRLPGHQAEEISFPCVLFAFANGLEGFSSHEFHVLIIHFHLCSVISIN